MFDDQPLEPLENHFLVPLVDTTVTQFRANRLSQPGDSTGPQAGTEIIAGSGKMHERIFIEDPHDNFKRTSERFLPGIAKQIFDQ